MHKFSRYAISAICVLTAAGPVCAQRGTDWMTNGYDPQRSSWVRSDGKISMATMRKPGFALLWTLKLADSPRQLDTITPPALLDFYIGYRGFRTLGFFGVASDRVIGVDLDLGRIEWEKKYDTASSAGTLPCPGGMTSAVTRPTGTDYPTFFAARGAGRATPAKSGVGGPDQGAVTIKPTSGVRPQAPVRRTAPTTPDVYAARIQYVYALTGDGKLHMLWVSNGNEVDPAVQFIPAGAHAEGLVAYANTAYVATTNSCGGVDNGVWAVNVKSKAVSKWKSDSGPVAGTFGFAVRPDGTVFTAAGSEVAALAKGTLKPVANFKANGVTFTSSPVIFPFQQKDFLAVAGDDGRLLLFDTAALSKGPLDKTAPSASPKYQVGSLTTWEDQAGFRWVLAPTANALVAWKVVEKNGSLAWEKGWTSSEMISPLTPVVIDGVLFALSSGEFRSADAKTTVSKSKPAVLYALDPLSGQQLWSSGTTITSFVHSGGLSAGGGRIFVSGYDGTQYAFGFPMEH